MRRYAGPGRGRRAGCRAGARALPVRRRRAVLAHPADLRQLRRPQHLLRRRARSAGGRQPGGLRDLHLAQLPLRGGAGEGPYPRLVHAGRPHRRPGSGLRRGPDDRRRPALPAPRDGVRLRWAGGHRLHHRVDRRAGAPACGAGLSLPRRADHRRGRRPRAAAAPAVRLRRPGGGDARDAGRSAGVLLPAGSAAAAAVASPAVERPVGVQQLLRGAQRLGQGDVRRLRPFLEHPHAHGTGPQRIREHALRGPPS